MPELFNPNLPGQVWHCAEEHVKAWRKSLWRRWDELTADEQAAHVAALPNDDEPEPVATQPLAVIGERGPDLAPLDLSNPSGDATPSESTQTPDVGDTEKE